MREREMRARVERFLQSRLRSMLVPATLGLGLAIGGCNSDGLSTDDGGDQSAKHDAGNADAGPVPMYSAPLKLDGGVAVRYMAQQPDARLDLATVAVYQAQNSR